MTYELLPSIRSPRDLRNLSEDQLRQLAIEIREALCSVVETRPAHFASNLGVVELCLALHLEFEFDKDRLIWDTGHQIYPHKLVTGRFDRFHTIREKGGLMGYPNPAESEYDLFVTGHAGASVSTLLGLKTGDDLFRREEGRKSVAVLGDGALPSGIVFEAFNNTYGLNKDLVVVLNDNEMGICPRVGGLAKYLDRARTKPFYNGIKRDVASFLNRIPVIGESLENAIRNAKDGIKALLHGGMLFEELGFKYLGPIDGHDLPTLRKYLQLAKRVDGPVLVHCITHKGEGFEPACADPVTYHTPAPFKRRGFEEAVPIKKSGGPAYTNLAASSIHDAMEADERVCVITAAMCQGNKLEPVREAFPSRFFDTGICEGHAVAFAAGLAKAGGKPICDIYSTFLQRSFDQIFQEVALQNLPVVFTLDRAGLCGPDGPTHHGLFDLAYMRVFPNLIVMAPGDADDMRLMLDFALEQTSPVSMRYPKTTAERIERSGDPAAIELGKAEVIEWGSDGNFAACGALLPRCVEAAERLRAEGHDVGVINARFARPVDESTFGKAATEGFLITVEEGTLQGGFGSAVLESLNANGIPTENILRLGIPDRFIEHGDRNELLADLGLDVTGLMQSARTFRRDAVLSP